MLTIGPVVYIVSEVVLEITRWR